MSAHMCICMCMHACLHMHMHTCVHVSISRKSPQTCLCTSVLYTHFFEYMSLHNMDPARSISVSVVPTQPFQPRGNTDWFCRYVAMAYIDVPR